MNRLPSGPVSQNAAGWEESAGTRVYPTAQLRQLIEATLNDDEMPVEARIASLRIMEEQLVSMAGLAGRYRGTLEMQRDGLTESYEQARTEAYERAELREELLKRGLADEQQLDRLGYWSKSVLEQAEAQGTLEEAFSLKGISGRAGEIAKGFGLALLKGPAFERMVRRSRTGQFIDKPGGGDAVPGNMPDLPDAPRAPVTDIPDQELPEVDEEIATALADFAAEMGTHPQSVLEQLRREGRVLGPDATPEQRKRFWKQRIADLEVRVETEVVGGVRADADKGYTGAEEDFNAAGRKNQYKLLDYVRRAASGQTTKQRYTDENGHFTPERRQLHASIIDILMRKRRTVVDPDTGEEREVLCATCDYISSHENPTVLFMGGGYSAGKGGVRKQLAKEGKLPDDALVIDPDVVKSLLPEFAESIADDPEANLLVYEEAWVIAQKLQQMAQEQNMNVVVDGITDTSADEVAKRVRSFLDAGYSNPRAVYVDIPTEEALMRSRNRAENASEASDRRYIPEVIMRAVHRDVAATVPGVLQRAPDLGLTVEVWNNHQGKDEEGNFKGPKRFIEVGQQSYDVEDEALLDEFLGKAFEESIGDRPERLRNRLRDLVNEKRPDLRPDDPDDPEKSKPLKGPVAGEQLGTFESTEDKWSIPDPTDPEPDPGKRRRIYDPERRAMHERIVEEALEGHQPDPEGPKVMFLAGIPAAGKTSTLSQGDYAPPDAITINSDDMKAELDEFKAMAAGRDPYSGHGTHDESKKMAMMLLDRARERGLNIVVDGVGNKEKDKFADKIKEMQQSGYSVQAVVVADLPPEKAKDRSFVRSMLEGRFVQDHVIDGYAAGVPARYLEWRSEPDIPWVLYNTDVPFGSPPVLVAQKPAGVGAEGIDLVNEELHQSFIARAQGVTAPPRVPAADVSAQMEALGSLSTADLIDIIRGEGDPARKAAARALLAQRTDAQLDELDEED